MTQRMKNRTLVLVALAMLTVSTIASAHGTRRSYQHHHGSRVGVGIVLSAPLWYPGPVFHSYPYRPYYQYPYPVAAAPVYVERDDSAAVIQAPAGQYWYYCRDSATYYPYVKQCAEPWQRVPVQPPTP